MIPGLETIEWAKRFSIGIEPIDEQHEQIVSMYNDICHALDNSDSGKILFEMVVMLAEHTKHHFGEEERVMRAVSYPQMQEHVALHQELLNQLTPAIKGLNMGRFKPTLQLMHFLRFWICNHIEFHDKPLGKFVASATTTHRR